MGNSWVLAKGTFNTLLSTLNAEGYKILSPQVEDSQVRWLEVSKPEDLNQGFSDQQSAGSYQLIKTEGNSWFSINHGAPSLKNLTYKPRQPVVHITKTESGISFQAEEVKAEKVAVIGARACDVAALQIQDKVFLGGLYKDEYFKANRESLFIIAVNCTRSVENCFCASMGTGPKAKEGFDIALTELADSFLVEVGSDKGEAVISQLNLALAAETDTNEAQRLLGDCASLQCKKMPQHNFPQELYQARHNNHWQEVANHCLSCANCTMVCPTCFCHSIEETPDLARQTSERVRVWDSCFNPEHGYIHGKNMRPATADRYRMWMTHKLGTWVDQFDSSGCTGCGRCITWCPAGIDLVAEAIAVLEENK